MTVVAIDPGYRESAWLTFDGARIVAHGIEANEFLMMRFWKDHWDEKGFSTGHSGPPFVVLEQMVGYGMPVGHEVLETVFWTGRMYQAAGRITTKTHRLTRKDVKSHLCGSTKATDSGVWIALTDRFGGSAAVGKKYSQGPLYGIKSHERAALAIAVTWYDLHKNDPEWIRPGVAAQFTEEESVLPSIADA